MAFKDMLQDDLDNIFFSQDEFAEQCTWNKSTITAIVDDESMIRKYSAEFDVLPQGSHLIYLKENELHTKPNVNDSVCFNNNLFVINEVKSENGMLSIFLANGRI